VAHGAFLPEQCALCLLCAQKGNAHRAKGRSIKIGRQISYRPEDVVDVEFTQVKQSLKA